MPSYKKSRPFGAALKYADVVEENAYLSCVETPLKVVLRLVPIAFTLAIMTIEIPAAIRPYSIAVAPDSSFRNAITLDM